MRLHPSVPSYILHEPTVSATALQKSEAYGKQMAFCEENSIFPFTFSNVILRRVESQYILFCSTVIVYGTFIY